jgi:hypothetical protein
LALHRTRLICLRWQFYSALVYTLTENITRDLNKGIALNMLPFSNSKFDEFKDQRYADWRRIRLAIEHENTLVNHRITWLLTSQGFIVAGVVAVVNEAMKPEGVDPSVACIITIVLSLVSFFISLAIHRSLKEADIQIDHLDKWWYSYWAPDKKWEDKSWDYPETWNSLIEKSRKHGHPEIQGKRRDKMSGIGPISFRHVARLLQLIWLVLLIVSSCYLGTLVFAASQRSKPEGVDRRLLRIPNQNQQVVASEAEQSKDWRGTSLRNDDSSLPVYLRLNTGGHAPYMHVKTLSDRLWNNWRLVRQYSRLAELDRVFYIDLAIARNNLASTLGDMKLWEEAKKEAGKALEVTQKIPAGAESYGVRAAILNNLGVFNNELGYVRNASGYFQSSQADYQILNSFGNRYEEQIEIVKKNSLSAH